jgi:hypothetical protein
LLRTYVLSNCVFSTSPSSWTNTSLEAVFTRTYTSPIATYYPYNATNITTTTIPTPDSGGGSFPSWAGAVIGVVVGVLLLVGAFAFWFLRRRRKLAGAGGRRHSEASRGSRVMQWVHAGAFSPPNAKDADGEETTTVSGGFTNDETVAPSVTTAGATGTTATAEAGSEPVYEMQGIHPSPLFSDAVLCVVLTRFCSRNKPRLRRRTPNRIQRQPPRTIPRISSSIQPRDNPGGNRIHIPRLARHPTRKGSRRPSLCNHHCRCNCNTPRAYTQRLQPLEYAVVFDAAG